MADHIWGWREFFDVVSSFLETARRQYGTANERYSQYVVERLGMCITSVAHVRDTVRNTTERANMHDPQLPALLDYQTSLEGLLTCLRQLSVQWEQYLDHLELEESVTAYTVPIDRSHERIGRPRLGIGRDQLEYFVSLSFNWTQVAAILGVSRMTVYRRRREFGMLDEPATNISDGELRVFVEDVRRNEPESGEVIVMGELRSHGYRVTRHRVRHAIQLSDPLNTPLRWGAGIVTRRPYSVPGPNSLWHIGKLDCSSMHGETQ